MSTDDTLVSYILAGNEPNAVKTAKLMEVMTAAVLAERERCAMVAEALAERQMDADAVGDYGRGHRQGVSDGAEFIAIEIRKEPTT